MGSAPPQPAITMQRVLFLLAALLVAGLNGSPVKLKPKDLDDLDDGPVAERITEGEDEAQAPAPVAVQDASADPNAANLMEEPDEGAGDQIMKDINGMKEKFENALTKISDEVDKDQKELEFLSAAQGSHLAPAGI